MSNTPPKPEAQPDTPEAIEPEGGVVEPQGDDLSTDAEPLVIKDPLTALQAERDQLESKLLRVSADYQNYIRRAQQNTADACQQQLMQLARDLLTPLDQFDHALAIDPEKTEPQALLQGVQIVRDELMKVLERVGIQRIVVNPGDPFDPVRHEAIQRMAAEGIESGAVAQQLQPGYVLDDKTLRPAMVVVAE